MDVVGYFLALTNLQAIGGRSADLNNVSFKTGNLETLANYLNNYPGFSVEHFKKDQINYVGDVGMYLSNNLQQYCINGKGNADEEGVVITFTYKIPTNTLVPTSEDDKLEQKLADHIFLFRKEGLSDDTVRPLLRKLHNPKSHRNRFVVLTKQNT